MAAIRRVRNMVVTVKFQGETDHGLALRLRGLTRRPTLPSAQQPPRTHLRDRRSRTIVTDCPRLAPRSEGHWLLPSEFFRRQMYATFWFEQGIHRQIDLYPDNVMFESDFPIRPACRPGRGRTRSRQRKRSRRICPVSMRRRCARCCMRRRRPSTACSAMSRTQPRGTPLGQHHRGRVRRHRWQRRHDRRVDHPEIFEAVHSSCLTDDRGVGMRPHPTGTRRVRVRRRRRADGILEHGVVLHRRAGEELLRRRTGRAQRSRSRSRTTRTPATMALDVGGVVEEVQPDPRRR